MEIGVDGGRNRRNVHSLHLQIPRPAELQGVHGGIVGRSRIRRKEELDIFEGHVLQPVVRILMARDV
jgi:hypothetical protein